MVQKLSVFGLVSFLVELSVTVELGLVSVKNCSAKDCRFIVLGKESLKHFCSLFQL